MAYQRGGSQLALAFFGLRREDVAKVCFTPLHFPGPGLLEALGSAFVSLQFRH